MMSGLSQSDRVSQLSWLKVRQPSVIAASTEKLLRDERVNRSRKPEVSVCELLLVSADQE